MRRYIWSTIRVWSAWLARPVGPIASRFARETFTWLFALTGIVVGLHKGLSLFFGPSSRLVQGVEQLIQGNAFWLLPVMGLVALCYNWPRPFARVKIDNRRLTIEVVVADLFEIDGNPDLVIGGNTGLITRTSGGAPLVAENGVQGQFQRHFFCSPEMGEEEQRQAEENLANELRRNLSRQPHAVPRIGDVSRIQDFDKENPQRLAYYLLMAKPNSHGGFETSLPEVKSALAQFWGQMVNASSDRTLAMHLLGTGVLGLAVSRQLMAMEMVDSLVEASYHPDYGHIVPLRKLIVAIHPEDCLDDQVISFYELQQHLNTLKRLCS